MGFGLGNYSVSFVVAYVAGTVFLLLFCVERFDQPARKPGSFVETLVPRHLATHAEYLRAFLIYFFIMWAIYTLLTLAGPSVLQVFAGDTSGFNPQKLMVSDVQGADLFSAGTSHEEDPVWFPLLLVLLLSGVSTRYPVLNSAELIVRRLTHRIIGIPEGIQRLAESLNRARIDVDALNDSEVDFIKNKYRLATGDDLKDIRRYYEKSERQGSVLINWIRLNFLFNIVENRRRDLPETFDANVLEYYSSMWTKIKSAIYDLPDSKISECLGVDMGRADDIEKDRVHRIEENVKATLRDIHAIIAACIAHSTGKDTDLTAVMKALKLRTSPERRIDLTNAFISALFVVFVFVFGVVFATPGVVGAIGYSPSALFPNDYSQAIGWATSTLFLHGAAALAAWRYRERKGTAWKPMKIRAVDIPAAQYMVVMFYSFLAATFGLAVWWVLRGILAGMPFTLPSRNEAWIPLFGLIGAVTGFWVCYTLDVAQRAGDVTIGRLGLQALLQGAGTGGMCFLLLVMMPDERIKPDLEAYAGSLAGLAGLIICLIVVLFVRRLQQKATEGAMAPPQPGGTG